MRYQNNINLCNINKGFALFVAVITMSVLLLVSFAIMNITLKEMELSTTARDSQYAFYASDAGLECALYWDSVNNKYGGSIFATSSVHSVDCSNVDISQTTVPTFNGSEGVGTSQASSFTIDFSSAFPATPYCAKVVVTKTVFAAKIIGAPLADPPTDDVPASYNTTIYSSGYNTCNTNSVNRVERSVLFSY